MSALDMATPLASFAGSITCFGFALSLSSSTSTRTLLQIASLSFTAKSFFTCHHFPESINSTWALMMAVWTSHSISVLWLEPIHTWQQSHPKQMSPLRVWNNPRLIGLPGQIIKTAQPLHRQQSLTTFVIVRLAKAALFITIYYSLLPHLFSPFGLLPVHINDFDSIRTTFFRRLLPGHEHPASWHEAQIRCVWAGLWAFGPYLTLEAAHSLLAVFFVVLLRFDEPSAWPSLFGSLAEAYSMRRFWSQFWHRLIMRPYTNLGKVVARKVMGLQEGSRWEGLVIASTVFALSGVAHAAAAAQLGDELWALDVVWFVGCFAAGASEAVLAMVWKRVSKRLCSRVPLLVMTRMEVLSRLVDFLWVFLFFFWSVPKWQYPKLDRLIQSELQQMAMHDT